MKKKTKILDKSKSKRPRYKGELTFVEGKTNIGSGASIRRSKPKGYEHYLTFLELAAAVARDPSFLRRLERQGRIPKPARARYGQLLIRMYSPEQVEEIREILAGLKWGRPPKS